MSKSILVLHGKAIALPLNKYLEWSMEKRIIDETESKGVMSIH